MKRVEVTTLTSTIDIVSILVQRRPIEIPLANATPKTSIVINLNRSTMVTTRVEEREAAAAAKTHMFRRALFLDRVDEAAAREASSTVANRLNDDGFC